MDGGHQTDGFYQFPREIFAELIVRSALLPIDQPALVPCGFFTIIPVESLADISYMPLDSQVEGRSIHRFLMFNESGVWIPVAASSAHAAPLPGARISSTRRIEL
jgi:hypothetical protein